MISLYNLFQLIVFILVVILISYGSYKNWEINYFNREYYDCYKACDTRKNLYLSGYDSFKDLFICVCEPSLPPQKELLVKR